MGDDHVVKPSHLLRRDPDYPLVFDKRRSDDPLPAQPNPADLERFIDVGRQYQIYLVDF